MKKSFNKNIFLTSLMFFSVSAFSQNSNTVHTNTQSQTSNNPVVESISQPVKLSPINQNHINILNQHLSKSDYNSFFSYLAENIDKSNKDYLNYLLSHRESYHVPVYWLIADYYAKEKNSIETHSWFYTAMIMTQQDASVCSDKSSRTASHQLLRFFPAILDLLNKTPHDIRPGMQKAMFFVQNVKIRKSPLWVCSYGNEQLTYKGNPLIPQDLWVTEMNSTFKHLTRNHAN